jgi:hypothetical protein
MSSQRSCAVHAVYTLAHSWRHVCILHSRNWRSHACWQHVPALQTATLHNQPRPTAEQPSAVDSWPGSAPLLLLLLSVAIVSQVVLLLTVCPPACRRQMLSEAALQQQP